MWVVLQPLLGMITGLFGTGITEYFNLKKQKLDLEIRKVEMAHEITLSNMESARVEKLAGMELEKELSVSADALQAASYKTDKSLLMPGMVFTKNQQWMIVLAEVFNRLVRPSSTVFYQLSSTGMFVFFGVMLFKFNDKLLTDVEFIRGSFIMLVDTTLYLASTCTTWYFGIRGVSAARKAGSK